MRDIGKQRERDGERRSAREIESEREDDGRHEERMQKVKGCNKVREQIQRRGHARQRASKDADRKEGDGEGERGRARERCVYG